MLYICIINNAIIHNQSKSKMAHKTPSQAAIEACKEYTAATLEVITLTPVILAIQEKVLAQFNIALEDGTPVTDVKRLYLASDDDAAKIYEALHAEYTAAGYKLKEAGYCPLLMAEEKERKAARKMNEAMDDFIPGAKNLTERTLCTSLEAYRKLTVLNYSYLKQFAN